MWSSVFFLPPSSGEGATECISKSCDFITARVPLSVRQEAKMFSVLGVPGAAQLSIPWESPWSLFLVGGDLIVPALMGTLVIGCVAFSCRGKWGLFFVIYEHTYYSLWWKIEAEKGKRIISFIKKWDFFFFLKMTFLNYIVCYWLVWFSDFLLTFQAGVRQLYVQIDFAAM